MMLAVLYEDNNSWQHNIGWVSPSDFAPGSSFWITCDDLQRTVRWSNPHRSGMQFMAGWIPPRFFGQYTPADFQVQGLVPLLFFHRLCNEPMLPEEYDMDCLFQKWEESKTIPTLLTGRLPAVKTTEPPTPSSVAQARVRADEAVSQYVMEAIRQAGIALDDPGSADFARGFMKSFTSSLMARLLVNKGQTPQ
jgi:hypothetical protein